MPQDARSPVARFRREYDAWLDRWQRCRDVFDGEDAVKAAGQKYLPKLSGHSDSDYAGYKLQAEFYNATSRTVVGLSGLVFRTDPAFEVPTAIEPHLDDITLTGKNASIFSAELFAEVLLMGRGAVLIDMPSRAFDGPSPDIRPYWSLYTAEEIINWQTDQRNGREVLTLVALSEKAERVSDDGFTIIAKDQIRVLRLDFTLPSLAMGLAPDLSREEPRDIYTVELWQKEDEKKEDSWRIVQRMLPMRRGETLDAIPFQFFGSQSLDASIDKPPLLDMVNVNLSHYRSSADLEHGRKFTSLPTPWVSGVKRVAGDQPLRIGSQTAWTIPDSAGRAGMLEYTGQGLGALETALTSKEAHMAALGARLLEEPKRAAETAEATRLKHGAEHATLRTVAELVSDGLERCLQIHARWFGLDDAKVSAQLSRDLDAIRMEPAEALANLSILQAGQLSWETFYSNLQRGDWTRPGVDAEEERKLIEAQDADDLRDGQAAFIRMQQLAARSGRGEEGEG